MRVRWPSSPGTPLTRQRASSVSPTGLSSSAPRFPSRLHRRSKNPQSTESRCPSGPLQGPSRHVGTTLEGPTAADPCHFRSLHPTCRPKQLPSLGDGSPYAINFAVMESTNAAARPVSAVDAHVDLRFEGFEPPSGQAQDALAVPLTSTVVLHRRRRARESRSTWRTISMCSEPSQCRMDRSDSLYSCPTQPRQWYGVSCPINWSPLESRQS